MRTNFFLIIVSVFTLVGCESIADKKQLESVDLASEKEAIINCLNNETKAAFQRNYSLWTEHWVHESDISKTYINHVDSSYSESLGWEKISDFVRNFIEEHPEPEPLPKMLEDIDLRLYGNGAWVSFEQLDSIRGWKRESRLMEKQDGTWKIAGMHTSIYGFK